jgi:hypothetical protein
MTLTGLRQSWLVALADPAGPPKSIPPQPLPAADLPTLLTLAERHGVLPALVANYKDAVNRFGPARVVSPASAAEAAAPLADAEGRLAHRTGITMLLRHQAGEILEALARASVPAVILKGTEFADRLYPRPALRLFSDVDLLIPVAAAESAARIMEGLGYRTADPSMKYAGGYGEQVWQRPGRPGGLVEIHWNLVNSPTLQRTVSVALEDLALEDAPGAAGRRRPTAASLLLVAAVHGATSHAFDRLQILCDVAQAVRGAAGPLDEPWLAAAAGRTGATLSLVTALRLAGEVLGEPRCGALCARLSLPRPSWLSRLALSPAVVLRAHAPRDGLRRQAFRELLKRR